MMSLKDKLIVYIYNKTNQLEQERSELKYSLRHRPTDELDLYEILVDRIRVEVWDEYIRDLYNIVFHMTYRDK